MRIGYRQAEARRREREREMQERESQLQTQQQAELERKAAERREIRRLSKTFALTLEGGVVLDIPPKVSFLGELLCFVPISLHQSIGKW